MKANLKRIPMGTPVAPRYTKQFFFYKREQWRYARYLIGLHTFFCTAVLFCHPHCGLPLIRSFRAQNAWSCWSGWSWYQLGSLRRVSLTRVSHRNMVRRKFTSLFLLHLSRRFYNRKPFLGLNLLKFSIERDFWALKGL